jgi:hypothetical protein
MNIPLFLFCGGASIHGMDLPKPLMKIRGGKSLLSYFLIHIQHYRPSMPSSITLLCDTGQEEAFEADLRGFSYPVPIRIQACGHRTSTFEKFTWALRENASLGSPVQFGYPDIFSFEDFTEPPKEAWVLDSSIHISAAALTSRFPRLIVDVYSNKIKGISNYTSSVPANPMYVFGGDMWGKFDQLLALTEEFLAHTSTHSPSLEFDFFSWLVNLDMMNCQMMYGERMWVDSSRDVNMLLAKTGEV